jgi:ABC-type branched-subunit amino acid transport system substrate-binding protein
LLFAAVFLVTMAAACGGDEDETPTGTATPAATGAPSTPTGTGSPAATGTAEASGTPSSQVCGAAAREATLSPDPSPGVTDTEILLGSEAILSGTLGAVYATVPGATKAYFDYINDTQGGVCGRKIVYKVEDNHDDPARALEAARKLVEQDKVFAMVGSLGDGPHPGSWDWLNENGVPDILVSAGGARFGADPCGRPWTVQMIPSYTIDGTFLAQYVAEFHPGKTVAILWENDTVGQDGSAGVKQTLDPSSNPIIAEESYEYTAISIASEVANLAKSKADVLVLNANLGFTSQAITTADRLGWHPQLVMPYINGDELVFNFVRPELMEGAVATDANKLSTDKDTDPAVARHFEIMKEYGGPNATNFTMYAQILGELAVDILGRTCDNLTREGLMEAVESTKDFHSDLMLDGVNISFSPTDHVAYQSSRYLRATVDENGKGHWEYFGEVREFQGQSQ